MSVISFLCPTRGRTTLFKRMCEAIIATTADISKVEIITYIDEDDVESQQMQIEGIHVEKVIQPKAPMGICNQMCLDKARGDIIILMNDDVILRTKHWDVKLRAAVSQFSDDIYLMYPNDLFKKSKLGTFPILSKKVCDILQTPFPKQFQGNFIDTHLFDMFQRLRKQGFDRICYLDDIVFEHMHYRLGKGNFDATYQARRRFGDDIRFVELVEMREIGAKRLIQSINQQTLSPMPVFKEPKVISNFLSACKHYFKIFAMNTNLPLKWRMWLFTHFLARYWARKLYSQ